MAGQGKTRFAIDRVWVLGAGATRAFTANQSNAAPLDIDFLEQLRNHFESPLSSVRRRRYSALWSQFCKALLGSDKGLSSFQNVSLEGVMQKRIATYDALEVFKQRSLSARTKQQVNSEFIANLAKLVTFWLKRLNSKNIHLMRLVEEISNGDKSVRVVTFNYDVVLDDKLLAEGIDFDDLYRTSKRGSKKSSPLILKMHGSLNWGCHVDDFNKIFDNGFRGSSTRRAIRFTHLRSSGNAENDLVPLIIPPMPAKPLNAIDEFRKIWTMAFEYLSDAREIVIFGYSCPPSDELAQALFENLTKPKGFASCQKITVVDPRAENFARFYKLINNDFAREVVWEYHENIASYYSSLDRRASVDSTEQQKIF